MQVKQVRRVTIGLTGLLAAAALAAALATPALAVGPGLPLGYDVQRIDPAAPGISDTFGFGVVNGGDLNGDGEDDILAAQGTRILNDGNGAEAGEVDVISGETGALIAAIPAPEADAGCSTAAGAADRCQGFGFYITRIGQNLGAAPFTDLGSCAGGDGGDGDMICDAPAVGAPDGIPDVAISAPFVDVGGVNDIGRIYVFDGDSLDSPNPAVIARLDMPPTDVADLAGETEQLPNVAPGPARPWFGRTVLNPAGFPPCEGNLGVGACVTGGQATVQVKRGDMTNGGLPDIVIGASAYKYDEAEANGPPSCGDNGPQGADDVCQRSGRVYMYSGEAIAAQSPASPLDVADWNIMNPFAQEDDPASQVVNTTELWGHSVLPVGDVGACAAGPSTPGENCPPAPTNGTLDGRPEVLISDFRVDYPRSGPDNEEMFDAGINILLDGATGRRLHTYTHPDPQPGSIFGFNIYNQPAVGDLGQSATAPDMVIGAPGQDSSTRRGEGMAWAMNGQAALTGNTDNFALFDDPTPQPGGSFGTSIAGVGDLAGDARSEVAIGEFSSHNPPQNPNVLSDVTISDPLTEAALQTIPDPDQQANSNFGLGLQPLADVNEDGFLDFAMGAPRFDNGATLDAGRVYILRSNNTSPELPTPTPTPTPQEPAPETAAKSDRSLTLDSDKGKVKKGKKVRLTGQLDAPSNESGCEPGQSVEIQRRKKRQPDSSFAGFRQVLTDSTGNFSLDVKVKKTFIYRARVLETESCDDELSNTQKVSVKKKR